MGLKIFCLMKQVPVPSQMRMGADGLMDRTKAKSIINVDCTYGLEQGLELKSAVPGSELIVLSMGPPSFEQSLRKAVAMGYDRAVLLSDRGLAGSDTFSTGWALATVIRKMGYSAGSREPFVIFSGRQTTDGDTAHVPSQVAENLGIPQATFVEKIESADDHLICRRIIEGGYQVLKVPMPCLISVAPTAVPARRPSLKGAIKSRAVAVDVWNLEKLGIPAGEVGLVGSPTMVAKVVDIERSRPAVTILSGQTPEEIVEAVQREFESGPEEKTDAAKDHPAGPARKVKPAAESAFERVDFRKGARGVLTWVEVHGKTPARSSLEILNPARKLADRLGTGVVSVLIGDGIRGVAPEILASGADDVIVVDDPRLKEYSILPFTSVISQVIREKRPEIALFGATTSGRELAPRIASRVKAGVTADCTSLEIGEFVHRMKKAVMYPCLESIRPTYGESKLATIVGFWCPQMATARPGTFPALAPDFSRQGVIRDFKPLLTSADFLTEILQTVREEGGADNLFTADVIISGGRDCGEMDDFCLIKELAEALRDQGINADWGASRQAVDHGYAPYARQIGQTGKTVRPKLYIAVAISGAIQHLAGIKESGKILAIDHDGQANIFRHADYGIIKDYREVLPSLISRVSAGFTFGLLNPSEKTQSA